MCDDHDGSKKARTRFGFPPTIWGPEMWRVLHVMALSFPRKPSKEEQDAALSFLLSLKVLLPCKKCRDNYGMYISEDGPLKLSRRHVSSREDFFRYSVLLHNLVTLEKNDGFSTKSLKSEAFWKRYYLSLR